MMKKNILSFVVGATLILPAVAMAAPVNNSDLMPADMRTTPVDNTLQAEIEGPDGELLATQSGAVDIDIDESNDDKDNVAETAPVQPVQNTQNLNMQHSNANYQPLIAGEAASDNKAADAVSTLQEKKKDKRGELLATQPANVQFKENRRIAVSR